MNKLFAGMALGSILTISAATTQAAEYAIDTEGQHAFVNFKISHLGYSWLYGRFNEFDGRFSWDSESPEDSSVSVSINTASVDSNHAERDKHLRSADFLNVDSHPVARFESTSVTAAEDGALEIKGNLTLNGVTREVIIDAQHLGEGEDPWGGYRTGFEGSTSIRLKDYNIDMDLGPAAQEVELILSIEGIRQ